MSDLNYPKNGGAFLLSTINSLHAQIADLIDELVTRDQAIAALTKANRELTAKLDAPNDNPPQ